MSSTSARQPGLYLYVNYRGTKVARHFSNFTDDSCQVFRDDLVEMKFALPKTINTWLLARGCVVGFWPDVSPDRQAILYNNLQNKIESAAEDRSELAKLSIHSITLKELAWNGWSVLATTLNKDAEDESPRPAKRRRYKERTPSPSPSESSSSFDWWSPERGSSSQRRTRDSPEQSPRFLSPPPPPSPPSRAPLTPHAPVQLPIASIPDSGPTTVPLRVDPTWSASLDNLTTEQKIENLRSLLSRVKANVPVLLEKDKVFSDELKKLGATDIPPPMKLVDEVSDAARETELQLLKKRIETMEAAALTQLSLEVRLDEAANKLQEEQHSRQKLEEMAASARQWEADANRRLDEAQNLLEQEGRRCSEAEALAASTHQSATSFQKAYELAKEGNDDLARRYARAKDEISLFHQNTESLQRDFDRAQRDLREEKGRRREFSDMLAISGRSEAALRQRCDGAQEQIASLTRARATDAQSARVAKQRDEEALRQCEEKARAQQIVIQQAEGAMHAAQASEEALKRRLEEVERSLEAERRMRREAEDAIADIRRECREPFVVPSLLDAFVELAKLTTVATALGGLEVGKNKGKEKASGSGTPPPAGAVDGGIDGLHDGHVQGYSPQYTPPVSTLPDVRMESASRQVERERLSPA